MTSKRGTFRHVLFPCYPQNCCQTEMEISLWVTGVHFSFIQIVSDGGVYVYGLCVLMYILRQ